MKRQFAILALLTLQTGAFAQGSANFMNGVINGIYIMDPSFTSSNLVSSAPLDSQIPFYPNSGVVDVGLVWATSASSLTTVTGGTLAGVEQISQHSGELAGNPVFLLSGTTPGEEVYIAIYAWDSSYGDSLAGAEACLNSGIGYFGSAAAGLNNQIYGALGVPSQFTLALTQGPGVPIFGAGSGMYRGLMMLPPVPEPRTFSFFVVIGALAPFWLRRKTCRSSSKSA